MGLDIQQDRDGRLLVVQETPPSQAGLVAYLADNGFQVAATDRLSEVEAALSASSVDLVVLDLELAAGDDAAVCRRIVNAGAAGVLAFGDLADPIDRIVLLECGVDDCLPKPVNPRELAARARAVLRARGLARQRPALRPTSCDFAGFVLDLTTRILQDPSGRRIGLNQSDYELLLAFLERPDVLLSRAALRAGIGGMAAYAGDRMVDMRVKRLRQKLGGVGETLIRVVRGQGYRLEAGVRWR